MARSTEQVDDSENEDRSNDRASGRTSKTSLLVWFSVRAGGLVLFMGGFYWAVLFPVLHFNHMDFGEIFPSIFWGLAMMVLSIFLMKMKIDDF